MHSNSVLIDITYLLFVLLNDTHVFIHIHIGVIIFDMYANTNVVVLIFHVIALNFKSLKFKRCAMHDHCQ